MFEREEWLNVKCMEKKKKKKNDDDNKDSQHTNDTLLVL